MIIRYVSSKWRKGQSYLATTFSLHAGGSDTTEERYLGEIPRLPMFPHQHMERTWIEYLRAMHQIVENHIEDNQVHKVK